MESTLRQLPAIEKLIGSTALKAWDQKLLHSVRVKLARELISEIRDKVKSGAPCPPTDEIEKQLDNRFQKLATAGMKKLINATGVVLHTNLGRAPLGFRYLEDASRALDSYCSLEFDLDSGERGSRTKIVERFLTLLCDAPGAVVVNNNAAAVFLALHTFAKGKQIILSRGELVQIGGGFRIPDILEASGANLVEVGTTNMTNIGDYESPMGPQTAMILKVHQSNFVLTGHTDAPSLENLSQLSKKYSLPLVVDLGSGVLGDEGLNEPTVNDILRHGASLVCFSGDKLLGGPQAGMILGETALTDKLKKSPLYRALRLGKTELFLLEKTLQAYINCEENPTLHLIRMNSEELEARAKAVKENLSSLGPQVEKVSIIEGKGPVGGGTCPAHEMKSVFVELIPKDCEGLVRCLLNGDPPVVVRKEKKRILIDLRTVFPKEEAALVRRMREACQCMS